MTPSEPRTAPRSELLYDWHDSECGHMETTGFDDEPLIVPCDCEMPRLFRIAHANGRREALAEAVEAVRAMPGGAGYTSRLAAGLDRMKAAVLKVLAALQEAENP